jgi:AAHS family 4-hydroxybenzoate transporter-like MFS transporter
MLWTGFPVGGVLAGVIAPHAIGAFGWRSMFYIGGVLPIVLAVAIAWTIPESLSILLRLGTRSEEVRRTVGRLWPALRPGCPAKFVLGDEEPNCGSVWLLFSGGRARFTILLCLGFFTTFLLLITTVVWTPTLLQTGGMNVSAAATALIALNLGSVVGTPLAGLLIGPQRPKRVLVTAFVFCAVALALLGRAASTLTLIAALMSMIGFLLGAGSSALIALVAQFYPDSVRSTALGAAMAAGRLGSFAGPLAVGILVGWHWSTSAIFTAIATPALVSALCAALLCSARAR